MEFSKWLDQAKELSYSALARTTDVVGAGYGYVSSAITNSRLFASTESSSTYDTNIDEKHYLLVPDRLAPAGYSIYVMRLLPDGVPPINDLPKHRVFHLPHENSMPTLQEILLANARDQAAADGTSPEGFGERLHDLADHVDNLDTKMFNGVLLIGGLVALVNPVAGAAVALHAVIPSVGMLLSKYGLRFAGDTLNEKQLANKIAAAEKGVLTQFKGAKTDSIVNPVLRQLNLALDTTELQYEPVLAFDSEEIEFGDKDRERFLNLTCKAIANTYKKTIADKRKWKEACLGPEDIRYLRLIFEIAESSD